MRRALAHSISAIASCTSALASRIPACFAARATKPRLSLTNSGGRTPSLGPTGAQLGERRTVEGARVHRAAQSQPSQAASQFFGRLAGECESQRALGVDGSDVSLVGDSAGEHPGLARARPCPDAQRSRRRLHRLPLPLVKPLQEPLQPGHLTKVPTPATIPVSLAKGFAPPWEDGGDGCGVAGAV